MVPYIGEAVADGYAGEEPSMADIISAKREDMTEAEIQEMQEKMAEYQRDSQEYWDKKTGIERIFDIFSPNENYEDIANEITGTSDTGEMDGAFWSKNLGESEEKVLTESLGLVLPEIFSLLMLSLVMLIGAYLKFMRLDIR